MLNRRTSMLPVSKPKPSKAPSAKQRAISTQTESTKSDFSLVFCQSKQNNSIKNDYMKALTFINSCHKCINETISKSVNGSDSFLLPKIADYSKLFDMLTEQKAVMNDEINKHLMEEIGDVYDQKFEILEVKQEIIHEILQDSQFLDEICSRIYARTLSKEVLKNEESDKIAQQPDVERLSTPVKPLNLQKSKYTSVRTELPLIEEQSSLKCLSNLSLDSNSSDIKTDSDLDEMI